MLERGKSVHSARVLQKSALPDQIVIRHELVQHMSGPVHDLPARLLDSEVATSETAILPMQEKA